MKTTSLRARAPGRALQSGTLKGTLCALLATTAYCGLAAQPAQAQTAREHRALDSNGVDLTHGDFVMAFVEGSIGSGESELALVRSRIGSGNGSWHVSSGGHRWDGLYLTRSVGTAGPVVSVIKDSRFERFISPGTLPSGSSLTAVGAAHHYRTADGTLVVFADPSESQAGTSPYCNGSDGQDNCTQLPLSITAPDGKTVEIAWEIFRSCSGDVVDGSPANCSYWARIDNVSNSFGYRVAFTYAADGNSNANGAPPPDSWQRRLAARFYNDTVSSAVQAQIGYDYESTTVVKVSDPEGRVWRFTGNGLNITGIRRPGAASDTVTIGYDASTNSVASVTNAGVVTQYEHRVLGNVATMKVRQSIDGRTLTSEIESDLVEGRPVSVKDPLGHITAYQYDAGGRPTRVTRHEGNYVAYSYDERGNVIRTEAVPKGGSGPTIVTSAGYDLSCSNPVTCNRPNTTTDERGNTTIYTYSPVHGGVETVTGPAPTPGAVPPQTGYTYTLTNGEYRVTAISQCRTGSACADGPDEVKTTIGYDSNGNVASTSTGSGDGFLTATSVMTYDPKGDLLSVDGPLGGTADTSHFRYNAARQLLGTISPDPDGGGPLKPRAVRNLIDPLTGLTTRIEQGNVDSQPVPDLGSFAAPPNSPAVETVHDGHARPVAARLVSGSTIHALTQTSYDVLGRPKCTARRMNPDSFVTAPDACQPGTPGTPPNDHGPDRIVQTHYDDAGRVTRVETALGTADAADSVTMTYSANNLVRTVKDGEGNVTTFEHDGHDRLSRTYFPLPARGSGHSATPSNTADPDYEEIGYETLAGGTRTSALAASVRNRAGETTLFTYDALGRATFKDLPGSEPDVSYGYDLLGQLTSASHSGASLSFGYDALGRNVRQTGASGDYRSEYDAAGRRRKLVHPDSFFVTQEYNITGELVAIRENGTTLLATYEYDQLGRRDRLVLGNGAVTDYQYDGASRLSKLIHDLAGTGHDNEVGFAYNPAGQIVRREASNTAYSWTNHFNVSTSQSFDGLNRPIGDAHDPRSNRATDGIRTYAYDSENKGRGVAAAPWHYDPLGRLSGASTSPGTPPAIAYESYVDNLVAERTPGSSTVARRHVFGPGVDEPIVWYEGSSRRFLQADERGSIVAVTSDAGALLAINRYDEYGQTASTSNAHMGRFLYTGQRWFGGFGLYHYKNRVYDPRVGRFMQPDPIGYAAGMNLYVYAGGDPVNRTDPSGLDDKKLQLPDCTGTRISAGCGAGGIASYASGFSTAGVGGQYATGEASLNALGVDTGGMSGVEMRALAAEFLKLGEWAASAGLPNDAGVIWGLGSSGFIAAISLSSAEVRLPPGAYQMYQAAFLEGRFVGSALNNDSEHAIARNPIVRQHAVTNGTMFYIDSIKYALPSVLLQAELGFRGHTGIVEYIMPHNFSFFFGTPDITHARFIRNGSISGYPNNDRGFHPPWGGI